MTVEPDLCQNCSETTLLVFPRDGSFIENDSLVSYQCFILFPEDSVWGDVSKMGDSIKVEYGKLEELFSQKVTSPPPNMLSPESEDVTTRARRNSQRETEVRRSW